LPVLLIDGNNKFRRVMEAHKGPLRYLTNEALHHPDPVFWIWDGKGAKDSRRKLYPDYSTGREPPAPQFFEYRDLLQSLLLMTPAYQVSVPGYEADDVIATIVSNDERTEFHIDSNDGDFAQLLRFGVTSEIENPPDEPEWIRLYKACVGDPGDRIPGIKGFGKGAWEKLSHEDKVELQHMLEGDFNYKLPDALSKATKNWLNEPENLELARTFYKIIGFWPVPDDLLDKNMVKGRTNSFEIDKILRRLFQ